VIRVAKHLKVEELAPLTDAGLTPYRGIKKIRDAGGLGPDRVIGVFGVGGLGAYAVQYATLLALLFVSPTEVGRPLCLRRT
jgi:propanol-preferring alcohol dehydrogenase